MEKSNKFARVIGFPSPLFSQSIEGVASCRPVCPLAMFDQGACGCVLQNT